MKWAVANDARKNIATATSSEPFDLVLSRTCSGRSSDCGPVTGEKGSLSIHMKIDVLFLDASPGSLPLKNHQDEQQAPTHAPGAGRAEPSEE